MGGNGGLPLAGPDVLTWNRQPIDVDIGNLINTIIQAYRGEKYYLGTLDYDPAEWIILKTGKPVLTIGGFYGTDPILSSDELAHMVEAGRVRLFFVYEKTVHELRPDLFDWFHKNCTPQYLVPSDREDYFQLYDCR
jgi:4-amino-4-deoxy-L-arabinose transferase-like glycosyltransferase